MIVKIKNKTEELLSIQDIGVSILPMSEETVDTNNIQLSTSDDLMKFVSNGMVVINDLISDLSVADGIRFIISGTSALPKSKDGKLYVHSSSKKAGLLVYWTGRGDNFENGFVGNGEPITLSHRVGEPLNQYKYIDFNCIGNPTQMQEGYVIWSKTVAGDSGTCMAVSSVIPTVPGTNTNFMKYGPIILPAAGNGDIQIAGDLTNIDPEVGCFVRRDVDEIGSVTPGFWDADYNPVTRKFENIRANVTGEGEYNLFHEEMCFSRYVNHVNFMGDGSIAFGSSDSDNLLHGMRMKLHINTSTVYPDHDWDFSVVLTLYRDKTY